MPTNRNENLGELPLTELANQLDLLRLDVVVLRESLDEFREDLVHVLRKIADESMFLPPDVIPVELGNGLTNSTETSQK